MINFIPLFFVLYLIFIMCMYRKKNGGLSFFVLFCYFLISISSVLLFLMSDKYLELSDDFYVGSVFLSFCFFILLIPFVYCCDDKITVIKVFETKFIKKISVIVNILSLFSIFYFLDIVIKVFSFPELQLFRHVLVTEGHPFISPSVFNTMAGIISILYLIPMWLGFVCLCKNDIKFSFSLVLFLSSLSYPVYVLAYFGRDGALFWIMSFLSLYYFMKDFIPFYRSKKIKIFFSIASFIVVVFFVVITFYRFGDFEKSLLSILSYGGQQYLNFIVYFELKFDHTLGARTFTIVHDLIFDSSYEDVLKNLRWQLALEGREYMSWEWGTMFKDLFTDYGSLSTLLITTFFSLYLSYHFTKLRYRADFFNVLHLIIMCQLVWQGVFYFKQYTYSGNLYVFISLLLPIIAYFFRYLCTDEVVKLKYE